MSPIFVLNADNHKESDVDIELVTSHLPEWEASKNESSKAAILATPPKNSPDALILKSDSVLLLLVCCNLELYCGSYSLTKTDAASDTDNFRKPQPT